MRLQLLLSVGQRTRRYCGNLLVLGWLAVCLPGLLPAAWAQPEEAVLRWTELAPLPDAQGFAGMIAGVSHGQLFAAGGANFPDRPPWEQGTKVWYDQIYRLERVDGRWQRLPEPLSKPLGYAVTVSYRHQILVAGGESPAANGGSEYQRAVFALEWNGSSLIRTELPSLPEPISNACGAMLGSKFYLLGGSRSPTATETLSTVWVLDMAQAAAERRWQAVKSWPGPPRMLAIAAASEEALTLISGTDLSADAQGQPVRRYLTDAYRFMPETGWTRLPDLPQPVVAAASPAPVVHGQPVIISGDAALEVDLPLPQRTGFPSSVLIYDAVANRWQPLGKVPAPRVTVPAVEWNNGWQIISGEQRPGVRSPAVWRMTVDSAR